MMNIAVKRFASVNGTLPIMDVKGILSAHDETRDEAR